MAEPMTDERLAAIRARLDAATPGPWLIKADQPYPQRICANDDGLVLIAETFTDPAWPPADADLIANAPTDLADLIAEVERLRYLDEQFPCDGMCSPNEGPEETCSRHGRSPADLWERNSRLVAENTRLRAVAEEIAERAWDEGNCVGLDGWVGPGRGSEVDDEALHSRRRDVAKILKDAGCQP